MGACLISEQETGGASPDVVLSQVHFSRWWDSAGVPAQLSQVDVGLVRIADLGDDASYDCFEPIPLKNSAHLAEIESALKARKKQSFSREYGHRRH